LHGIFAVKALQAIGLKPEGTVILESVIEEEAGAGGGTLACMMQQRILTDAFIALEPQGPRNYILPRRSIVFSN